MSNRVDLCIAGYTLTIMSDRSQDHLERLGAMVNERVQEIQKGGSTTNYLNVILLAAITMADEVLELKKLVESRKGRDEAAEKNLLDVLQQALDP
ncbi:MAG TPA: cell division protein ZapA [Candidatus Deferrimicrobiaceae bacterium]|jgi:cell division protein ZapA (FtsZ GTPase activity inhibitor)